MSSRKILATTLIGVSIWATQARALDTISDGVTRAKLIDKFEHVLLNLAPADTSRPPILLRLADLYAEKGRQLSNQELDQGCTMDCQAGVKERTQAIRYYQEALPSIPSPDQMRVSLQIYHLKDMVGDVEGAIKGYRELLQANSAEAGEVVWSLGEIHFRKRKYQEAAQYFTTAKNDPKHSQAGLAAYRLAWCQFNLGQIEASVETLKSLLKTPTLLARNSRQAKGVVDVQFQEQVSIDLASFYGRTEYKGAWQEVFDLSPEGKKTDHVAHLAREWERLGKRNLAMEAWSFYQSQESRPRGRLESHVHLAELYRQSGDRAGSIKQMDRAFNLWEAAKCDGESCSEYQTRWRIQIVEWNKAETKAPSVELHQAYDIYGKLFSDDHEMWIWAGEVAKAQKNFQQSILDYQRAEATSAASKQNDLHEKILLAQVELAEMAKEKSLRESIYARYLQTSRVKSRNVAIRYQQAMLLYESDQYAPAAERFRELAKVQPVQDMDVQTKAAHLALDSLVMAKTPQMVPAWADEFGAILKGDAKEFTGVARKARLQQIAEKLNSGSTPEIHAEVALLLKQVVMSDADLQDRISYYKSQLLWAERTRELRAAREAVQALLSEKSLKPEDRSFALSRKAWLAELSLDFKTAFDCYQEIGTDSFRTATMAEMAGLDAVPYYEKFLKENQDGQKKALVAARLIRQAKKPYEAFTKYQKEFQQFAELGVTTFAEIYVREPNNKALTALLKDDKVAQLSLAKVLRRDDLLAEGSSLVKQLSTTLDSKTEARLSSSLKKRIALMQKLEAVAQKAVSWADWSAQTTTLHWLAKENERLYNEILSLPMPSGLNEAQQGEYMALLSQQAGPFQQKAQDYGAKVKELQSAPGAIEKLNQEIGLQTGASKILLERELGYVKSTLPNTEVVADTTLPQISKSEVSAPKTAEPKTSELEQARKSVRENPFSSEELIKLAKIEKTFGHDLVASYLEGRAEDLKGAKP